MAGLYPPPFLNTKEDRGAVVAVISFTSIAVSTLTNSIRVWVRQRSNSALGTDDALLVAANVSCIAGTWDYWPLLTARTDSSYRSDHHSWCQRQEWPWAASQYPGRSCNHAIPQSEFP